MPGITDLFKVYEKPSLDRLVIRKRHTKQTSARVEAAKDRLRALRNTPNVPSKVAHANLVRAGKCPEKKVYVPNKGWETRPVCPITEMRNELRARMKEIHRTK
jgi:hypothetical protein